MHAYLFDTPHSFSQQCLKNLNIFDIFFARSLALSLAPCTQTSSFHSIRVEEQGILLFAYLLFTSRTNCFVYFLFKSAQEMLTPNRKCNQSERINKKEKREIFRHKIAR